MGAYPVLLGSRALLWRVLAVLSTTSVGASYTGEVAQDGNNSSGLVITRYGAHGLAIR